MASLAVQPKRHKQDSLLAVVMSRCRDVVIQMLAENWGFPQPIT